VWLDAKNLALPYGSVKLAPRRHGPFKITRVISPVVYQLRLPPQWTIHPTFHASLLMPYEETEQYGENFSRPPPNLINDQEQYEVEAVRDHRHHGRARKLQYLIKWKGYPKSDNTWEPVEHVQAPQVLKRYHQHHPLELIRRALSLQRTHRPTWLPPPLVTCTKGTPSAPALPPRRLCPSGISRLPPGTNLPPHRPLRSIERPAKLRKRSPRSQSQSPTSNPPPTSAKTLSAPCTAEPCLTPSLATCPLSPPMPLPPHSPLTPSSYRTPPTKSTLPSPLESPLKPMLHTPPSPPGQPAKSWSKMRTTPPPYATSGSAFGPQPTDAKPKTPNPFAKCNDEQQHSSSHSWPRRRSSTSFKSESGRSKSPRASSATTSTSPSPAPPAPGLSSSPPGSDGWAMEGWRCKQEGRQGNLPTWTSSFSAPITHDPPQSLYQGGSTTSSMEPTAASTFWQKRRKTYPTGQHMLRSYDTAANRRCSATCSTTSRNCRPGSMPVGLDSTTATSAWKPPGSPTSSTVFKGAPPSSLGSPSAPRLPAEVEVYPIAPRTAKHTSQLREHLADGGVMSPPECELPWWQAWSNELREEMHQRRRNRGAPPRQVDKLPSSWSVSFNAAVPVPVPHSQSPRVVSEGDRHAFVLPWYRSRPQL